MKKNLEYPVFNPTNGKNILLVYDSPLINKEWIVAEFDPKYCPEFEELEVWGSWDIYEIQTNPALGHVEKEGNK